MGVINIGILGAGAFASRRHLPDFTSDPRANVVAACRRDSAALSQFADHFGIPHRYSNWEEMLRHEPMDAVLIATPHDQHYLQAKAALERGLHVLLEKPMTIRPEDSDHLVALAHEKQRVLAVGLNPPYWRHTTMLRHRIAEGKLGDLESIEVRGNGSVAAVFGKIPLPDDLPGIVRPTLFRGDISANGGGYLMDGGGHLLSEVLWVTGQRPVEVSALMDSAPDDMRSVITIRLESGLLASISAVGNSHYTGRRIYSRYEGSRATAEVSGWPLTFNWTAGDFRESFTEEELRPVPSPVTDWLNCIENGHQPLGTPEHGALVTRLLAAVYESARNGCSVRV